MIGLLACPHEESLSSQSPRIQHAEILFPKQLAAQVVTGETFGTEQCDDVTSVSSRRGVGLRRFEVSLRARHAFVSLVGPEHLAVAFVDREDHPGVRHVVFREIDAAILRFKTTFRIAAHGSDHEDVVAPDNRTRV